MRNLRAVALAALMAAISAPALAEDALARWEADRSTVFDAAEIDLADFQWRARLIVVFADTGADPRFADQMRFLALRPEELAIRDVVVVTDTDPGARSDLRQKLRPRGFALVIIGKDGQVALRKPAPWDVREITRSIDKMPLRREEIRMQSGGS